MLYLCIVLNIKQNNNKIVTTKNQKEMKTERQKTIGKIKDVTFRNHSICGNPSYNIVFEDEKGNILIGYTAPNAECANGCKNSDLQEFACIEYHKTKGGKIVIDNILGKSTYERLFANQK